MRPFRVARLAVHDRTDFDCGVPALNGYLQQQASQDMRRHAAACFVLIENSTDAIAGYYTLSAASVGLADLPLATQKRMPRYPTVPALRIGRLAMDARFQGRKLGGVLLIDAIRRAHAADLGIAVVVVDAKHEQAAAFHQHHSFQPLSADRRTWFLPMSEAVKNLLGRSPQQKPGEETAVTTTSASPA